MTAGKLIAYCIAQKREVSTRRGGQIPYFDESRHILAPVVMVDGEHEARARAALNDLEKWLRPQMCEGVRVQSNGQSVGFWIDGDAAPVIPHLWGLIVAWCTDRGYIALLRWQDEMMRPYVVSSADIEPQDVLSAMHLTHILRVQLPAEA